MSSAAKDTLATHVSLTFADVGGPREAPAAARQAVPCDPHRTHGDGAGDRVLADGCPLPRDWAVVSPRSREVSLAGGFHPLFLLLAHVA